MEYVGVNLRQVYTVVDNQNSGSQSKLATKCLLVFINDLLKQLSDYCEGTTDDLLKPCYRFLTNFSLLTDPYKLVTSTPRSDDNKTTTTYHIIFN